MADEKILTNAQEDESSTLVKFSKAYRFEGKDYTEVDLSGMDDLSAEDMIAADRYLTRSGSFSVMRPRGRRAGDDARIRLFHCRPCSEAAHRVLQRSAAQGCPQG